METASNADDIAPRSPSTTQKHTRSQSSKNTILPHSSKIGNQQHVRPISLQSPQKPSFRRVCQSAAATLTRSLVRFTWFRRRTWWWWWWGWCGGTSGQHYNCIAEPIVFAQFHQLDHSLFAFVLQYHFGHIVIESTDLYTKFNNIYCSNIRIE